MYNLNYYLSLYLFIMSCFMFSLYYEHLIMMIISLEFITISLVFNLFTYVMSIKFISYMVIYMLIFSVCEGALILSLLVAVVRFYGNDYTNSMSLMKW